MEEIRLFLPFPLNHIVLDLIDFFAESWIALLAYGISFYLLYGVYKEVEPEERQPLAQQSVHKSVLNYCIYLSFFVMPTVFMTFFKCIVIYVVFSSFTALEWAALTFLYLVLIYKILAMFVVFHAHALFFTRIFLVTIPLFVIYSDRLLTPFETLLDSPKHLEALLNNPKELEARLHSAKDFIATVRFNAREFVTFSAFSIPYILFFTFSKRIKAAWAAPGLFAVKKCADRIK